MRANAGGTAEACARCHGGADDAGGTLEDLKRLGNGRRLNFGDVASADERPPAPTIKELTLAVADVLREHAANLRAVPDGGRVSVGVTLSPEALFTRTGDGGGARRLTDVEREAIEVAEEEADFLAARKKFSEATRVLTEAISPLARDAMAHAGGRPPRVGGHSKLGILLAARLDSEAQGEVARVLRAAVGSGPPSPCSREASSGPFDGRLGEIADALEATRGASLLPARLTVSVLRGSGGEAVREAAVSFRDPAAAE